MVCSTSCNIGPTSPNSIRSTAFHMPSSVRGDLPAVHVANDRTVGGDPLLRRPRAPARVVEPFPHPPEAGPVIRIRQHIGMAEVGHPAERRCIGKVPGELVYTGERGAAQGINLRPKCRLVL